MRVPEMKDEAKKALNHIHKAVKILRTLEREAQAKRKWPLASSFDYYADELEEIISSDKGQSGLTPLVADRCGVWETKSVASCCNAIHESTGDHSDGEC